MCAVEMTSENQGRKRYCNTLGTSFQQLNYFLVKLVTMFSDQCMDQKTPRVSKEHKEHLHAHKQHMQ